MGRPLGSKNKLKVEERPLSDEVRVVSVTGAEIACQNASGVVAIGRADGEVIEDDVTRVLEEVQAE